jgi:hypothetical protein
LHRAAPRLNEIDIPAGHQRHPRFHDFGLTASIRHVDRQDFGPARDLIEAAKGSRARQAIELQSGADKNICRTERIA